MTYKIPQQLDKAPKSEQEFISEFVEEYGDNE